MAASAIITVMAASFGFFAPLAYGSPMSAADFEARMWLDSWSAGLEKQGRAHGWKR